MNSYYAFTARHVATLPTTLNEPSDSVFYATYVDMAQCTIPDDGAFLRLYQARLERLSHGPLSKVYGTDADLSPGGAFDPAFDEWANDAPWTLADHHDIRSHQWHLLWND